MMTYGYHDISSDTDSHNFATRSLGRRGTLVHTTSGRDSRYWLQHGAAESGNPASCDCLISRDGSRWLFIPQGNYAYHAGHSEYIADRRYTDNEVSQLFLGVELECLDEETPTPAQIDSLAEYMLIEAATWRWRWPLLYTGHYAVARPLGRRSDPVNFPWGDLAGRVYVRALAAQLPGLLP